VRLWDKGVPIDQQVLEFTVGEDYILDRRLVPYDILASQAHVRMLGSQGHLKPDQVQQVLDALAQALSSYERGDWSISLEDEDCHTALEAQLGEAGALVHLGRSRNDQVLTAVRLYLLDAVDLLFEEAEETADAILSVASDTPLPGYTHMQRAMPSTVADWAGAFANELRDSAATMTGARGLLGKNPLGSAAGYGTPGLPLDREQTTEELGFRETHEPVTAPQLSRGKGEAALAFGMHLILQDLGRLAADLCLYNTTEFGFVKLPAEFTTGSSIMPQKRNPDVFELVRGHSGQSLGDLTAILGVTSKMTSGYHRDLQLIKSPLFRLIDRTLMCLRVMKHALPQITFVREKTEAAMDPGLYAAERAFKLAKDRDIPFRQAYRIIAEEIKAQ